METESWLCVKNKTALSDKHLWLALSASRASVGPAESQGLEKVIATPGTVAVRAVVGSRSAWSTGSNLENAQGQHGAVTNLEKVFRK